MKKLNLTVFTGFFAFACMHKQPPSIEQKSDADQTAGEVTAEPSPDTTETITVDLSTETKKGSEEAELKLASGIPSVRPRGANQTSYQRITIQETKYPNGIYYYVEKVKHGINKIIKPGYSRETIGVASPGNVEATAETVARSGILSTEYVFKSEGKTISAKLPWNSFRSAIISNEKGVIGMIQKSWFTGFTGKPVYTLKDVDGKTIAEVRVEHDGPDAGNFLVYSIKDGKKTALGNIEKLDDGGTRLNLSPEASRDLQKLAGALAVMARYWDGK